MTTYRISAPAFVGALIVSSDFVLQAAPILHWAVGKDFRYVRDYCAQRGWIVEPLPDEVRPNWFEFDGQAYELHWVEGVLTRVTRHDLNEERDLRFDELPEVLKQLL